MIDLFAWIVLITMIVSLVAVIVWLGLLPARIATERNHIHKDAITVGSWVFLLAGGVLWPLILVWSYMAPAAGSQNPVTTEEK